MEDLFSEDWFKSRYQEVNSRISGPDVDIEFHEFADGLAAEKSVEEAFFDKCAKFIKHYERNESLFSPCTQEFVNRADSLIQNLREDYDQNEVSDWSFYRDEILYLSRRFTELKRNGEIESDDRALEFESLVRDSLSYLKSAVVKLYENPKTLITARTGMGKTHTFCSITRQRLSQKKPTLLIFAKNITPEQSLWDIFRDRINLAGESEDAIFNTLDQSAESFDGRALILVDALEEAKATIDYDEHLVKLNNYIDQHSNLALGVTLRETYTEEISSETEEKYELIQHPGFEDYEFQAIKQFFDYYNIQPEIPILSPEFSFPQLLELFCRVFDEDGRIPRGQNGLKNIFEKHVKDLDDIYAEKFDYDNSEHKVLWEDVIKELAELMAEQEKDTLKEQEILLQIRKHLTEEESESVIAQLQEDLILLPYRSDEDEATYTFTFRRFSSHLIIRYFLRNYLDTSNPEKSLEADTKLGDLLRNTDSYLRRRHFIRALQIELPEWTKPRKELLEIVPEFKELVVFQETFLESLIWRNPAEINLEAVNEIIQWCQSNTVWGMFTEELLDTLITICAIPNHDLNAKALSDWLSGLDLATRDSFLQPYFEKRYPASEPNPVSNLINWPKIFDDYDHLSSESKKLLGLSISWCLSSSNRPLRDNATKSLVRLLESSQETTLSLIEYFLETDATYVIERIIAASYGAAMRNPEAENLVQVAEELEEKIFENSEEVYPNILLRDHAENLMKFVEHRRPSFEVSNRKITPPFNSSLELQIPSTEELKKKYRSNGDPSGLGVLWHSVIGYGSLGGDFARYIIGTNSGNFEWTSFRFEQKQAGKILNDFLNSLTDEELNQINLRKEYEFLKKRSFELGVLQSTDPSDEELKEINDQMESVEDEIDERMLNQIFEEFKSEFDSPIQARLEINEDSCDCEFEFQLNFAQRWIFNRVMELGWDSELHGDFDERLDRRYSLDRHFTAKPERIGKKYQWIAYYEFLARISDNFVFEIDAVDGQKEYKGAWQIDRRDIDPSLDLTSSAHDTWESQPETWWNNTNYEEWPSEGDEFEWLSETNDLPSLSNIVRVSDKQGTNWISLGGSYDWEEESPLGKNRYNSDISQIWYQITSYLIPEKKLSEIKDWFSLEEVRKADFPKYIELYQEYLGEMFWSEAYNHIQTNYFPQAFGTDLGIFPRDVFRTTDKFEGELSEYDASINESFNFKVPSYYLADRLPIEWEGRGEKFVIGDEVFAFDPSVQKKGPSCLLVRKRLIDEFLDDESLRLFWIVEGHKEFHTPNSMGTLPFTKFAGLYFYKGDISEEIFHSEIVNEDILEKLRDEGA